MLSQYFKSSFNIALVRYDFLNQIRKLLLMPMLVFIGLFISTGASADYDIKVEVYDDPEEAHIKFNGQPPPVLGGFDQYTIEKFDLKIGSKNHAVSKHSDDRLFASIKNLENFDHSLDQWPVSYLVLTYDLSFTQGVSEAGKCYRTHFSWQDWFWWTKAPYTNCIAKVLHAVRFNQTKSIDVTDLLKKKFDDELQLLSRDVDAEKLRLMGNLFDRSHHFHFMLPDGYPKENTGFVLAEAQSRVVFGIATIDYFTRPGLFLEVFDNLTIMKNLANNIEISASELGISVFESWYHGYELELFKAFSSVDCKNQLSQKIIHNIQPSERLRSRAQDYANHVCQYNQIKFAENNLDANTFAHEYHDYDIQAAKPVYKPYVFCDAYTCQFNLSKTHKYKIVDDYDVVFSAGSEFMDLIYGYFHPNTHWGYKDKICSDTTCFIPISDLDALNVMFDKLKNNTTEEDLRYAGWTLIEIND